MKSFFLKYPEWALVLLSALVFIPNLASLEVNIMEARNFVTAREMLTDGNWVLTTMDGLPRYEKPPLPTWFTALFASIFGIDNLWALRLPSAIMGILLVLFLFKISKKLQLSTKQSLWSALIAATSFYIVFASRNGTWDIFAHSFMLMGLYYFIRFCQEEKKLWNNSLWAGIFIGISFLSKGPISHYGLMLPFLIAFLVVYGKDTQWSSKRFWLLGVMVGVATASSAWWWLYIQWYDAESLARITERETNNWTQYNVKPFYYYWNFFIQSGLWTIPALMSLLYPYLRNKTQTPKAYLFAFLWTISAVVLLSLIPEKKARYLLPVLIPLALTCSFYIIYIIKNYPQFIQKWERWPIRIHFLIIALVCLFVPWVMGFKLTKVFNENTGLFIGFGMGLIVVGAVVLRAVYQKNIEKALSYNIVLILLLVFLGIPLSQKIIVNKNYKSIAYLEKREQSKGLKVYSLFGVAPEFVWDYGKPIPKIIVYDEKSLPKEDSFGVLQFYQQSQELSRQLPNYQWEWVETFDLNRVPKDAKAYKERLKADYYILRKIPKDSID